MEPQLTLQKMLSTLDPQRLTKDEFVTAFKNVVVQIQKLKLSNAQEIAAMQKNIELLSKKLESDNANYIKEAKDAAMEYCKKILADYESRIVRMEVRVATVRDGESGKDGKDADPVAIRDEVIGMIKLPEYRAPMMDGPEEIRNKLELLQGDERLSAEAIKGLEAFVKKYIPIRSLGSVTGPSVIVKNLYNQSFAETPDGVRTTFTLIKAPRTPGAERVYQNNTRRFPGSGNDYTVAGRTVTFNVAPSTGDILLYDIEW